VGQGRQGGQASTAELIERTV